MRTEILLIEKYSHIANENRRTYAAMIDTQVVRTFR